MRFIEKQYISLYRPQLNVPFVRKHVHTAFEHASDSQHVVKPLATSSKPRVVRNANPDAFLRGCQIQHGDTWAEKEISATYCLQKRSLSALVLRLGELRRKGSYSNKVLQWVCNHKPDLIPRLLDRLPRLLC
eukprot:7707575-Pyramimonas_sp.AAC.1